jgi:drug/metabolite transporter (DMT)-like permease
MRMAAAANVQFFLKNFMNLIVNQGYSFRNHRHIELGVLWIYYAVSSVIFFVVLALIQRAISVNSKFPRAMSVVYNLIAAVFALIIFGFTGGFSEFQLPTQKEAYIYLGIAVTMYALFERGRFLAAKLLDASIYATVGNVSLVVAFVGATLIYGEAMTVSKQIGAALVLVSLILVSLQKVRPKEFSFKGLFLAIIISVFLGIGWMLDKKGTIYFSANNYVMLGWVLPVILIYLPYVKTKEIVYEFKRSNWKLALMSLLNVIGYYLQLKALELGDATRVIPIVQSSAVITVVLGIILLKETDFVGRKIVAGILAFIGSYFLVV